MYIIFCATKLSNHICGYILLGNYDFIIIY